MKVKRNNVLRHPIVAAWFVVERARRAGTHPDDVDVIKFSMKHPKGLKTIRRRGLLETCQLVGTNYQYYGEDPEV